jgi:hypothetical protein
LVLVSFSLTGRLRDDGILKEELELAMIVDVVLEEVSSGTI